MTFITYLKLAICSVQAFLCDSSTAVVVMIILWGIYLINIIVNNQKLLNFFMGGKRLFLLVAIGFVFVVFLQLGQMFCKNFQNGLKRYNL